MKVRVEFDVDADGLDEDEVYGRLAEMLHGIYMSPFLSNEPWVDF